MKLLSNDSTGYDVGVVDHPRRQLRMRLGSLTWALTTDEAVALATALADAVQAIRKRESC